MNCYNVTSAAPNNIWGSGRFICRSSSTGEVFVFVSTLGGSYVRRMTSTKDGRVVKIISSALKK